MTETYKVYVQINANNCILSVNSSAFLNDVTKWVQIDEGLDGMKYGHAQRNYFPRPIYTDDGIPRYKLVDSKPLERTEQEIQSDRDILIPPSPTQEERMAALESALLSLIMEDANNV